MQHFKIRISIPIFQVKETHVENEQQLCFQAGVTKTDCHYGIIKFSQQFESRIDRRTETR